MIGGLRKHAYTLATATSLEPIDKIILILFNNSLLSKFIGLFYNTTELFFSGY